MKLIRNVGIFALILVLAHIFLASPPMALACTQPPGGLPNYTLAERAQMAPIIIEGTVTAIEGDPTQQTAIVEVSRYLKGSGPAVVAISRFGSPALCLSPIGIGGPYIIMAQGDAENGYSAFYASQFDAVFTITDDQIAEDFIEAIGQDPTTPDPALPPAIGALQTGEAPPIQTIEAPSNGGPPIDVTSFPPPLLTETAQAMQGAGNNPANATLATPLPTPNSTVQEQADDEDSDVLPFALGFIVASVLWLVLGLGYWMGRRGNTTK